MLRQFQALPTEDRARAMKGRDYLWCLANSLLDGEESLETLCPTCRARALEERCPVCGQPAQKAGERMDNPSFDQERFQRMRGGGLD